MHNKPIKGRGATDNPAGRFAAQDVELVPEETPVDAPPTEFRAMQARQIISTNRSPDIPFDRSINPYQGCEHGCVYCYARPSHSYLDLSPGLDFETKIFYKPNAVERLKDAWSKPGYTVKPITIGANTDPYQPGEKTYGLTRALLETFLEHRHPVALITKGGLMVRDLDILERLAAQRLVSVAVSIPTASSKLKRIMEPRVPAASVRFALVEALADAGVPVSVMLAPLIPAINDGEIEDIVARAAASGAQSAAWILLRLPHELKHLFREWLSLHFPDRAQHVMSLLREASGGKDYDNRYGIRQTGRGAYASVLAQRFAAACRKHGLVRREQRQRLDCSRFKAPGAEQLALDW